MSNIKWLDPAKYNLIVEVLKEAKRVNKLAKDYGIENIKLVCVEEKKERKIKK